MQYRNGTISITNGSAVVTGNGTAWVNRVRKGSLFAVQGQEGTYTVLSVANDGSLTLTTPWQGATLTDARYWITTDFTPFHNLPLAQPTDLDATKVIERALTIIDQKLSGTPMGVFAVADKDLPAPPINPANGVSYIVPEGAVGAWSGKVGKVALCQNGLWLFFTASDGAFMKVVDEGKFYFYDAATNTWTLNPLATEAQSKVSKSGDAMTGALRLPSGGFNAPSLTFSGDTDTGVYRPAANTIGVAVGGSQALEIRRNGLINEVVVRGDLYVEGRQIVTNTTTVEVEDNIILLNKDTSGAPTENSGIEVERGTSINAQLVWDETLGVWRAGLIGSMHSLAARQDAPLAGGVAFWNDAAKRFDTASGLMWNGTSLSGSFNGTFTGTVAGLQASLDTKLNASVYTAIDVLNKIKTVDGSGSGLDADLLRGWTPDQLRSWDNLLGRPETFPSTPHRHSIGEVDGLQEAIDGKIVLWDEIQNKPPLARLDQVPTFSGGAADYEGGEIRLAKPPMSSIGGDVALDVVANSLRFFENGGAYRGAYIHFPSMASGANSRIWTDADFSLTTFANRSHNHGINDVSGLSDALSGLSSAKAGLTQANTFTVNQTFNGGITVKDSLTMTGADPYLRRDNNSAAWVIAGGQGWTDTGAVIVLHGKNHPARPGDMLLYGVDGNATSNLQMDGWKTITMNRRPTFAGATPWDSSNLGNPAVRNGYNEFQSAQVFANGGRQIRLKTNAGSAVNYGLLHHMDADNYYWLLTNQNDADGEFNGLRPLRMSLASGDIYLDRHLTTQKELHAYGDTHLPSYTRLWDRGETGYTVLEYRRQASGAVIGAHTFVSGSNDNPSYTMSVFKNGNTNDRSDLILDYGGGFSWRGRPVWTGWNFNPDGKVSWTDTNMDGGAYTVVRRNGDGGGFFTGRLHAYSQTATNDVWNGGIEIQEAQNVGNTQSGHAYAPALTFHWKNVAARSIYMGSDAWLYIGTQGDKSNLGNLGVNRISSDGNELWLQKNKATKLKIHDNGINAIGNCDVDGSIFVRGSGPTVYFQDSDNRSGMIHVNGSRMYFLRGSGNNSTTWESTGSGWPLELNLDNNDAYFAGEIWSGTNRWFRVRGSGNGIYWENHGGGFHMSDNDWVRVYNGKNLYCQAQVRANTVVGESDRRLKTNIAPILDATKKVAALSGVTFDWKRDGSSGMGFIAQEFKRVLPALVTEDADGMMGVEYGPVVALLVEALKETNARVALLEGRV